VGVTRRGSVAEAGDRVVAELVGGGEAAHARAAERLLATYRANAGKHLFAAVDGRVYARLPVHTDLVKRGDDLIDVLKEHVDGHVRDGDIVVMAEKPVASSQGRSYHLDEIKPTALARLLSRAVTRTPHGIGLGIPQTMQLAIDEAGAPRILLAAVASAAGRLFGRRGLFYRIAGPTVEAIDGPTPYTLPPHNTHAKLGPKDPDAVAKRLAAHLSEGRERPVGAAIIDASDLTATVLGRSSGVDRELVATLMRDNPLGQGHEQTPVAVLRLVGELAAR
jgi:hypothetical protein